ncbi:MAG: T9SS type A sorting domain-containing protein, partial [Chitinophagales bacterium]|nr:T9SS type A sorting domain-containing protein [Chitinophagales bacterium]
MKKILFISLIVVPLIAISQQQPVIWYFGHKAGLDFSSGSPVAITNGKVDQWEGVATACDIDGNLLFYTDGIKVWNKNHVVMANGNGLYGNSSTTQSATVVPVPGNSNQYYLFTLPEHYAYGGFRYSIVDLTLNGGLGDIGAIKNVLLTDSATEQCAVITSSTGCVWILIRSIGATWRSYLIDSSGIQTPVLSTSGSIFSWNDANGVGYMKASPQHNKIGIANYGFSVTSSFFELYDFNNATGIVSNAFKLQPITPSSVYACEFSPDGNLFYGAQWGTQIYQYDLNAGTPTDIQNSALVIGTAPSSQGAMQIAPDGKIYCSADGQGSISQILNPNVAGSGCNYVSNSISLNGKTTGIGLPSLEVFSTCNIIAPTNPPSFNASDTTLCEKFCINFFDSSTNNPVAWEWIFEGASPATSSLQNPIGICYQDPGAYDVTLITTNANGNSDTLILDNYITVFSNPFAPTITQNGNVITSSFAYTYQWQLNGINIPGATDQSYTITQDGLYTVIVTNENGCGSQASFAAILSGIENVNAEIDFTFYPNPSNGNFVISFLNATISGEVWIDVVNALGQNVYSWKGNISFPFQKEIQLNNAADGIYFLHLKTETISFQQKILISK